MARRRKKDEHLILVALRANWKFSAGVAIASLVAGFILAPAVARGSVLLAALVPVAHAFALLAALTFGLIALVRYVAQRQDLSAGYTASHSATRRATPGGASAGRRPPGDLNDFAAPEPIERHVAPVRREPRAAPRSHEPPAAAAVEAKPATWSLELLRSLDWKRFEEVVAAYFREMNFRSETLTCGPDGGVDVRLFFGDSTAPVALVQCKAWKSRRVGVAEVRELLGVMAHEKTSRGYFAATGDFTGDAVAFAKANRIMLISGPDLLAAIGKMGSLRSATLLTAMTEGDYTTPTCASCGDKLYRKTFRSGAAAWVCKGYPKCKTQIWTKADGPTALSS